MQKFQRATAIFACALIISAAAQAAEVFKDVEYLYKPEGKDKPKNIGGKLIFDAAAKSISFESKKSALNITEPQITSLLYERTASPRYAAAILLAWPLIFTKTKKHFLTIQYKTANGEGEYAIFHLEKGDYRRILAATEATTGRKVERQEEH